MRRIIRTSQFKKDSKAAKKRNKDIGKLAEIVKLLQADKPLPKRCRDHALTGDQKPSRDCHIEPDWLLIYDNSKEGELKLIATGSHADLFG